MSSWISACGKLYVNGWGVLSVGGYTLPDWSEKICLLQYQGLCRTHPTTPSGQGFQPSGLSIVVSEAKLGHRDWMNGPYTYAV